MNKEVVKKKKNDVQVQALLRCHEKKKLFEGILKTNLALNATQH